MSIELKVGEWYETRGGERMKSVLDVRQHGIGREDCMVAVDCVGALFHYHCNGNFLRVTGSLRDIGKHLPECTGWDWKPDKWRPARPADLEAGKPVPCRAKDLDDEDWRYSDFIGFDIGDMWKFTTRRGRYSICEVRDE